MYKKLIHIYKQDTYTKPICVCSIQMQMQF